MDIFGIIGTVAKLISGVPQTVAKIVPQGLVRDRVAEASTWQGLGVVGGLIFLIPDVNIHQQWAIILIVGIIGLAQIVKNEKKNEN